MHCHRDCHPASHETDGIKTGCGVVRSGAVPVWSKNPSEPIPRSTPSRQKPPPPTPRQAAQPKPVMRQQNRGQPRAGSRSARRIRSKRPDLDRGRLSRDRGQAFWIFLTIRAQGLAGASAFFRPIGGTIVENRQQIDHLAEPSTASERHIAKVTGRKSSPHYRRWLGHWPGHSHPLCRGGCQSRAG